MTKNNAFNTDSFETRRQLISKTRTIVALDVPNYNNAIKILKLIEPHVDGIKISYPLIMNNGLTAIQKMRSLTNLPIIADLKIADIPETSSRIAELAFEAGVDGIIVHGFMGRDSLESCVKIANLNNGLTFVVTELSNPGAAELMQNIGDKIAKMALEVKANGLISPATRPNRIQDYRRIVGDQLLILSPGVGAQGGNSGIAIINGADFEIIGRRIYDDSDPLKAIKKHNSDLQSQLLNYSSDL